MQFIILNYKLSNRSNIFPTKDEWKEKILFIETAEGKSSPEKYKKMLEAIKEKDVFEVINGIIVGKPQDEVYYEKYKSVLKEVVDNPELPILYNVNFGHAYPRCILPYGLKIQYIHSERKIIFKENIFSE